LRPADLKIQSLAQKHWVADLPNAQNGIQLLFSGANRLMPAQAGHWRTRVQLSVDMLARNWLTGWCLTVHHSQPVQNQHLAGMTFKIPICTSCHPEYRLVLQHA
jgi:hypothetical protein